MSASLPAQPPAISQNGVVNSASQIPPTLAGGVLAPGARFAVSGVRLKDAALVFRQKSASWNVRVLSSSSDHIEGIVPDNMPPGQVELRVHTGAFTSQPFAVTIVRSSPGLYSRNGLGWGPGRIRNLAQSGRENSFDHPAQQGERIAVLATGTRGLPEFYLGGSSARLISMHALDEPGSQEFTVEIPRSAPESCFVPLFAQVPGAAPSNVVTVAIRRGGGACRASTGAPVPLLEGRIAGVIVLSRTAALSRNGREKWVDDHGTAVFANKDNGPAVTPLLIVPPPGTCTVYTGSSQSSFTMPSSLSAGMLNDLGTQGIDEGRSLLLRNAKSTREIPYTPGAVGYYNAPLGTDVGTRRPLFLNPGEIFTLASARFTLPIGMPNAIEWTNRDQISEVDRAHGVTLAWHPRTSQTVLILASNADQFTTARAICFCAARGQDGQFTIPPAMLANFPVTYDVGGRPYNQLGLAAASEAKVIQAPVSGSIVGLGLFINARIVNFR